MIDGGAFWDIIGDNVVSYLHNIRSCSPKPIIPGMPMSVISEGKLTHNGTWKTSRSRFGTMVTDPTGHKDMAYRIGNISYMPEPMLPSIANVPTPLKARPEK